MKKLVLLVVIAILIASSAHAAITVTTLMSPNINNGSLEGGTENAYWGNPTGWTYEGQTPWNQDAIAVPNGAHEGLQATQLAPGQSSSSIMYLLPSYTITADTTYEMSFWEMNTSWIGEWVYLALKAVSGSTKTTITTPGVYSTFIEGGDTWQKFTFNTGAVSPSLVGQQLEVSLWAWNAWYTIDDVSIIATTTTPDLVPEPSSLIALMTGIVGISGLVIRKRK